MTRIGRIASTTAFKLSAIYLAVFTVFALIFAIFVTYAANQLLDQQVNEAIASAFDDLSAEWNRGGTFALINAIEDRGGRPGASLYLLTDHSGRILAGNVTQISTELLARAIQEPTSVGYRTQQGEERLAMVQVARLTGGMLLLVGRDMAERERFADIIRLALIVTAALLVGLGILSWFFVSRRVLKRIDSVAATTQQIMAGDLTGRLEVTGTNDEFDRLAASLNEMLERIEALLLGLKEVSDNIAHDLKTPLTHIRNRIEAALAEPPAARKHREVMQATIDDADQLIDTFNALLMIAQLEAGTTEGAIGEVDATEIAGDVAEMYEPVAERAGVTLTVDAEGPVKLRGHRELLGQALANLVDNAIKHGGPVDGEKGEVRIRVARDGNEVTVIVADNGPGVPEVDRGRVLQRFTRLEKSRSTPGTGLGLSLVAALVKLAHGSIELTDARPGLVATMRLPVGG